METVAASMGQVRLEETARKPIPPFTYHVYIAHSHADAQLVSGKGNSLCRILKERFGINALPRHLPGDNLAIKPIIDRGVWASEKCLILMTDNYSADAYRGYEIKVIHEKARSCSNDIVIVLWLNEQEVTEEFKVYNPYTGWSDIATLCNTDEYLSLLARAINTTPMASLTCLPKINMGYGAATGYFYGFLRLVLPDFRKNFVDAINKDPAAEPGMLNNTVCKMLIILPHSCLCSATLKDEDRIKNVEGFFVKCWANRAGNMTRDYKSSVYKLTDQASRREYYFAGELATPLLTMFESYYFGLVGMTQDQLYRERDVFCYTLHQVLHHPQTRNCDNQYMMIMWDDKKDMNDRFETSLYDLLLPILREELEKETQEQTNPSTLLSAVPEAETSGDSNEAKSEKSEAFERLHVKEQSMTAIYERSQFCRYHLGDGVRGKALIISIINYSTDNNITAKPLGTRLGADLDEVKIKMLFQDLGFEPEVHQDVNMAQLEKLLMFYSDTVDHTDYDAFLCCIMTHGNLGKIFTSDGVPYRILDVVDMFSSTKCSSLCGKPKLFFVQSCQSGADEDSPSNSTSSTSGGAIGGAGTGASQLSSTGSWEFLPPERQAALKAVLVPGEPDILMSYSALPGTVSYRSPEYGSLYINALDANLRKDWDIERALKKVTEEVGNKLAEYERNHRTTYTAQLPFHLTTGMSRLLYLTPVEREEV